MSTVYRANGAPSSCAAFIAAAGRPAGPSMVAGATQANEPRQRPSRACPARNRVPRLHESSSRATGHESSSHATGHESNSRATVHESNSRATAHRSRSARRKQHPMRPEACMLPAFCPSPGHTRFNEISPSYARRGEDKTLPLAVPPRYLTLRAGHDHNT
jgi:hypothetical protein